MPATLPANPGKTLAPDFLERATAALESDAPQDTNVHAGSAGQPARRPAPTSRADARPPAFEQPEDFSDADDQTGLSDTQQSVLDAGPDGDLPAAQDWTADPDVQEQAAFYGLAPDDLAAFPDQHSFVAAIRAMDRRNLLGGQQTAAHQPPPAQGQQPQSGQQTQQQQRQQLPEEVLEEVLKAEYLDDDTTKKAIKAVLDDSRMMRQALFGLMQQQAQQVANVESTRFDELVDELQLPDMGQGEELSDAETDRRIQVWQVVHQMRDFAQRQTGRRPALSKSLVERASYIAFPKAQSQKLRQTLESQSRRRLGTTVSSRGNARRTDTAESSEQELLGDFRERWKQHQRANGNY